MEVRSMFWYKQANLAFDLEKLFMDRFFSAVCTCTCGHAQVGNLMYGNRDLV